MVLSETPHPCMRRRWLHLARMGQLLESCLPVTPRTTHTQGYVRKSRPASPTPALPDIGPLLGWALQSEEADRRFIGLVRNARTSAEWVRRACAAGANANAVHDHVSALMIAARMGDIGKVDALLEAGADPNLPGHGSAPTALYAWSDLGPGRGRPAPAYDDSVARPIAERLLAHGCDVAACGSYPYPPLFSIKCFEAICLLLDCGVDPNLRGGVGDGWPGLFNLVPVYGSSILVACRDRGIDLGSVRAMDAGSGQTLFHRFSDFSDLGLDERGYRREMQAMVDILLQDGLDINQRDRGGCTPLMHIVKAHTGRAIALPAIDALLARGADPALRDNGGNTALHYASEGWVAQRLLDAGVDTECRNRRGERPDETLARDENAPVRGLRIREAISVIQAWRAAKECAATLSAPATSPRSARRRS